MSAYGPTQNDHHYETEIERLKTELKTARNTAIINLRAFQGLKGAREVARVGLEQLPAESITDIEIKRVAIGKIDHVLSTPSRTYQCGLCGKWPYDIDPLPCSKSDCPHRR